MMSCSISVILACLSSTLSIPLFAATLTVSKDGRGDFNTIQDAVDHSQPYDVVTILDTATYPEQVTLRAPLHHFTLRSANPTALRKPTIRWTDNVNVGPTTCAQALDTSKITFDKNGALRLINVRNIHIEGITIDAAGATPFNFPNVWGDGVTCTGQLFPLFHGNTGLVVYGSAQAIISDCEIDSAYFGIYIKDRDPHGPFMNRNGVSAVPPFARMALGNHLLEGNAIHHNTWGIFMESAWGLGSEFRDNLIYENHHATPEAAAAVRAMSSEGANQPGGAFFFKDVQQSSMTIRNNTLWHNFLILAGGFRPGAQHLIVNNIFAEPHVAWSQDVSFSNSFLALDPFFPKRMKSNAYAAQADFPVLDSVLATASLFDSAAQRQATGEKRFYGSKVVRIMNGFPSPIMDSSGLVEVPLSSGPKQVSVSLPAAIYAGAFIQDNTAPFNFVAVDQNRWLETQFLSTQPSDTGFLQPAPRFQELLSPGWAPLRYPEASGIPSRVGALPPPSRPQGILRLVPLAPIRVDSGQMVLRFMVHPLNVPTIPGAQFSGDADLSITYLRLEKNLPVNLIGFGGTSSLQLPEAEPISIPATPIHFGYNEIKLPASGLAADANPFGFVEMAIQGTGVQGTAVTRNSTVSNVAAFPIIPLTSLFSVEALDASQDIPATGITMGKTFRLRIAYLKTPVKANPVLLSTASGAALKFEASTSVDSSGNILSALPVTVKVQFTEVPDDGVELISATAYADSAYKVTGYGQSQAIAFSGPQVSLARGKNHSALKPVNPLKFRNLMGRKIRPR